MQQMEALTGVVIGVAEASLIETGLTETGLSETGSTGTSLTGSELTGSRLTGVDRKRVETVVETLAALRGESESLEEVAHDARNMATVLGLYCDLLEEPGVLAAPFVHYGNELRLVATSSRRLVEKLVALDVHQVQRSDSMAGAARESVQPQGESGAANRAERTRRWDLMPAEPIGDLATELEANRNLLAALAGPSIALSVEVLGGKRAVRMTGEDLTRTMVNLVKNAAEAMTGGGRIQITLRELPDVPEATTWLALHIEDSGPGIPQEALDKVFESGYTTHASCGANSGAWPAVHRGLGLSITRSIVEAAGGRIYAANRAQTGARVEIELPARSC